MFISIDRISREPVYKQIRDGIVALIQTGTLKAGDKLPGTRELASQLDVSRKTVLQAYLELAADNWVETQPGSCTYVLDRSALKTFTFRREQSAPLPSESPAGGQPGDPSTDQMDWSPYQLEGKNFGMPRYHSKWQGPDEWISFSRAIPDVKLFPFERIKKVSGQMLWDPKAYFFDYGHPQGYHPLVDLVEMRLAREGMPIAEGRNDIVIASGFQSGLNLLLSLLLQPGDSVAVEDPTFNSILNLLTARRIPHRGIPMESDGMDIDYLERVLTREKPRLIITIPTLHNPTGVTMSRAKRERLIELAARHKVPVIEDHWSLLLGHEGKVEPSLKALDPGGFVIQIGSFSKAFLPGTRVAWLVLPSAISVSYVKAKRAMDRSDSYFLQTLVHEFIMKGYLDLHCRKVERIYRARRDLMDELMQQHFPPGVNWKRPQGGFSFWVGMPDGVSSSELLERSVENGIEFAPGSYFAIGRRDTNMLRLSFSTLTQPQIRQGVKRLGQVMEEMLAGSPAKSRSNVVSL